MQFAEAERNNFKARTTIQSDGVELQLSLMDMDGRFTDEQKLERARKAMTAQAQRKLDMIGKISKALGMDVVVHDYMRGSNGYFGEDGKIHFVLSGHMSVARVAAHELTHQMQSVASEKYTVVRDQLIEDVGQDRFDRLLKRKAAQYGYNMESEQGRLACDEEVIAELCEGMLSDKDRLERFAERHTDTALTLRERLTKILNAIHATLKDTFGQNQNRISDMITDEKTADKWLDGLDEVLKKVQEKQAQENKSAIQYRIDETGMSAERKAEYDEYIQNALGGPGNNNEKQFTIGKVDARIAKWLERFGKKISADAVHVIADNDVRHIRNRHGIAKEGQYGVTTGDIQAIPYILKNANEKYFFPRSDGKSGILYVTDGVDTTYYVEEIFSEDALTGKQMIKTKKGTVPSAYENIINNKEAFLAPLDNAADAVPEMYVQDARQYDASTNKISQADKSVKGKFSLDEAYRKAVSSGNVQEQQKLVEQAAKEAGYTKLFYHGSKKGGGFTTFKNWQYFTENKQYAQRYAGGENGLYTTYVKMENTFDTRQAEARSLFNEARQELGLSKLQENGLPDWTDGYDLSEYIEENDLPYDSIILDEGGDMVNGKPVSRGLSYVIRNPEQIKSADAVTYDDAGNVIPLSERFNMGKKDFRYSLDTSVSEEYKDADFAKNGIIYTYDFLVKQKPIQIVTVADAAQTQGENNHVDVKAVVEMGMENALENGRKYKDVCLVRNNYTGREISVSANTLRHGLGGNRNRVITNAKATEKIGEILKNSIPVNGLKNKADVDSTYAMAGILMNKKGNQFIAISTIEQKSDKVSDIAVYDIAHAMNARMKKGSTAGMFHPQGVTPSTASSAYKIQDFLRIVNSTHKSILSESVLAALGETRPEDGTYSGQVFYSLDTEQLEKTVRAIDTKALEEGLQSMTLTSNVNSFTMKDPSRFFDAISKGNESLRDELHDIFEKPHSEVTGKYARGIKDMQERVRNIATEAGILSKDGKKFDKAASAAVQNIGEGIAPIACSVEAKVVEADTISLKATRNDSEILSGNCTLEAQFFGIWKRLVERQSNIKPLTWERLLPGYRRIL